MEGRVKIEEEKLRRLYRQREHTGNSAAQGRKYGQAADIAAA